MLGISLTEFVALAVVAMIVLGPEKLPRYAADAARFLRSLRRMADAARADVRRELGPEFDNVSLSDLNPRTMVRRHLLEPIDLDDLDDDRDRSRRTTRDSRTRTEQRSRRPAQRNGASAARPARPTTPREADGLTGISAGPVDASTASNPAGADEAADSTVDDRPPYDPDTT